MAIDIAVYINKIKPNLQANKNFDKFLYRFKIDNKQYKGIINLQDKRGWGKRDRISFAESELIRIKNKKKNNIDENVILDNYMKKYFQLMKDGKNKTEYKSFYKRYISPFIGRKKLSIIKQFQIKEIMKNIESNGRSVRTAGKTLEILRPAFKEAYINRIIDFDPIYGLTIKRPVTKKIVVEATDKLKSVYDAIEAEFGDNPYYKSLFLFALQGRRKNEILTLRWENIDMKNNFFVLRKTKNNEEQKIFLPQIIKDELLKFKDPTWEWVYQSPVKQNTHIVDIRRQTNKIKRRLPNMKFTLHYLRNIIVSAMGDAGVSSIYLSGTLGHNNPQTITKYLTLNYLKSSKIASNTIEQITKNS